MAFLCICPEKSLEFGTDEKLHRGTKEQYIRGVLESVSFGPSKKTVGTLPGGGLVIETTSDNRPKLLVDETSSTIAALTGSIQNYAYLVKKYLQFELQLSPNVTLEAIKERMPISEAGLLCKLYTQMGTGMVSKLRGQFSFCIYDSTTVRVLAGRDYSGTYPLLEGRLSDNSLFLTSGERYPTDAEGVEEIPAGCYKYGWHAGPVRFANPENEVRHFAEEASSAANAALAGLFCKPTDRSAPQNLGRRLSLDSKQQQQQQQAHRRSRANQKRMSLDSATERATRADDKAWWRSQEESNTAGGKSSRRRRNRRGKKSPVGKNPVEELLSQLGGGTVCEDSSSLRMLMKLLEDSPCSLVVTDAQKQDQLVFVNKSFEEQTGYSSTEVLGMNCRFLQAPLGGSIVQSAGSKTLHKAIDEGRSCSTRLINYSKDGKAMFNDCSIVPLRDQKGKITHHVGMHTFTSVDDTQSQDLTSKKSTSQSVLFKSR